MSVESTREVVMKYFEADHTDVSMMADDVTFTIMASGDQHSTPEGIAGMLNYFYNIAFDASAESNNLIIGDGHAVWEGVFIGRHIGEFAGVPATNKDVRVPLLVVYDVEDDLIKRGRVYFMMSAFFAQVGDQ